MALYTCLRCGANVPRSTALAGSAARCPQCYAPYRPPSVPRGSSGPVVGLILCAAVLGGLVFVAGFMFLAGTTTTQPHQPALPEEEFNDRQALLAPPPAKQKKAPAKPVVLGKNLPPIGPEVHHAVELSQPRRIGNAMVARYRVAEQAPLLLLQEPTMVVRCGNSEKKYRMAKLQGGDFTCDAAIPAGFIGQAEVYFTATWDREPGPDRVSNIVSLPIAE